MSQWTRSTLDAIDQWIDANGSSFHDGEPFPHAVIDNVFDDAILQRVLAEFPDPDSPIWDRSNDPGIQVKLRSNWESDEDIEPATRELVHFLNSGEFMRRLSRLTKIDHLISDPYYTGGGLNCILPGGLLDVHCDGNWHHQMQVHRRLNAILYLNQDWRPEWQGGFEMWDGEMQNCVTSVTPAYNRLLLFETHDYSYHGHPIPLACPEGNSRKSLILYFYTSTPRPADQVMIEQPHRALWKSKQLEPLS